ncbi:hypothetical protein N665_0474s0022 [Sinapis alba]|nr:hypothetical protein N665_0474s0022 [Sinapis alba]
MTAIRGNLFQRCEVPFLGADLYGQDGGNHREGFYFGGRKGINQILSRFIGKEISFSEDGFFGFCISSTRFGMSDPWSLTRKILCTLQGTIYLILNVDQEQICEVKVYFKGRIIIDLQRYYHQRKVGGGFHLGVLQRWAKEISSNLLEDGLLILSIYYRIFGIDWRDLVMCCPGEEEEYKKVEGLGVQNITSQNISSVSKVFFVCEYSFLLFVMTQGQLVGTEGSKTGGEKVINKLKISVPHFDNSALIKGYSRTLIGRCMNPSKQDVKLLITMLPKIWKVEDRVVGADLGLGRFQFDFGKEEDIEEVMKMQPFHFDYWMISLVRWQPRVERNYPFEITFWVRVLGVPLQLWAIPTFESIGGAIGSVLEVDIDYGRVKVVVDGFKCLVFETVVDFHGGEFYEGDEVPVSLRYEKLFGYCRTCFSLCHDFHKCPQSMEVPEKSLEAQDGSLDRNGARVASYKGVVINGLDKANDQQSDRREYQGKGKGKLYEEEDQKWINVSEKKMGKNNFNGGGFRGEARDSNQRSFHRERARNSSQENRFNSSASRGVRRERSPRENFIYRDRNISRRSESSRRDRSEETGLTNYQGQQVMELPNKEETIDTVQKDQPIARVVETIDDNLDLANAVLEAINIAEDENGMELEENLVVDGGAEAVLDGDEEFQDLTDEDSLGKADGSLVVVVDGGAAETEEIKESVETHKEAVEGEVVKKQGAKKKLFKAGAVGVGGTTRRRMVQALTSPRKRIGTKNVFRQEDGGKKVEEKVSLNPKPGSVII